jgi:energy-coupling factor transport system substrate-specific component
VLIGLLIGRLGAATLFGLVLGFVEMLSGSFFGPMAIVYAGQEGLGVDIGLGIFRWKPSLVSATLAGALANLIVNEVYIFIFGLQEFMVVGGITAIVSGAVLGGLVAWLIAQALHRTGVVSRVGLKGYEEIK